MTHIKSDSEIKQQARRERLAEELRLNLLKRKALMRERKSNEKITKRPEDGQQSD
jgi:hypothetical protein